MNHCHAVGVVHRDLKPENVIITEQGDVKIIDFGLSVMLSDSKSDNHNRFVGTPFYVAPEVIEGELGTKSDCWSLGVIMYALLTGRVPFNGVSSQSVFSRIKQSAVNFDAEELK